MKKPPYLGQTLLLLTTLLTTHATPLILTSRPQQTNLIELYTSEGCSSCPPAETWLKNLENHPNLWKQFIPIAFHVDYWNYLGWPDRFAQKKFTRRQRAYSTKWNTPSIYTPGFAINGQEQRYRAQNARWTTSTGLHKGQLTLTLNENIALIQYQPKNATPPFNANIALLALGLTSKIKAGENKGRTLNHSFIALHWDEKPTKQRNTLYTTSFVLPTIKEPTANALAITAWISDPKSMAPIQAVGSLLP